VTPLQVRQVAAAIERDFTPHIDLSDVPKNGQPANLLARGLAALGVQMLTTRDTESAAATIVDGGSDNGIDALCVEEAQPRIVLVQSKWRHDGRSTIGLGEARNFIAGLRDLTNEQFDRFNTKMQPFAAQVSAALRDPRVRIVLAVVTTGGTKLGAEVQRAFDDELSRMNEVSEILELKILGLRDVHRFLAEGMTGNSVDVQLILENWGTLAEPYQAFYGTASADQIAAWYTQHGDRLFDANLRKALGRTDVNRSVVATLREHGDHFWYFNNGITVLCQGISRTLVGSANRLYGQFALTGVQVVNGAQTVTSIADAGRQDPDCLQQAQVWVRLISLTGCPPGFGSEVTRATNTQNTVESRDFVALDAVQTRLRQDFALTLGKRYAIKRGEAEPTGDDGCSVVEAADALACAYNDPSFAVTAKSNRGQLLETASPFYSGIFTGDLTAKDVWHHVLVLRVVDAELKRKQQFLQGRPKSISVQGNRLISHLVFAQLRAMSDASEQTRLDKVPELTYDCLEHVANQVEANFGDNYITSLFKNVTKCRQITSAVLAKFAAGMPAEREALS
jgi:AIPR protein